MPTGRPALPAARSSVFAAVCVVLAGGAHAQAAGTVPAWTLATGFALVYAGARTLAGSERPLSVILPAVLAAQIVLHALFEHATGHAAVPGGASGISHHGGHRAAPTLSAGHVEFSEPAMLAGHLAAALACAWWLRRGEAALFSLLRWLLALSGTWIGAWISAWISLLAALLCLDPPAPRAAVAASSDTSRPPLPQLLCHCVRRRGPPVPAFPL